MDNKTIKISQNIYDLIRIKQKKSRKMTGNEIRLKYLIEMLLDMGSRKMDEELFGTEKFDRMQYLLGKSSLDFLTQPEQRELRTLISEKYPNIIQNKDISMDQIIELGLIIIGTNTVKKIIEGFYANTSTKQ